MSSPNGFAQAFSGVPVPTEALSGAQEGVVASADSTGLRVSLPRFHPGLAFGPCGWSRPSTTAGYPPVGTRCLVMFVGTNPWVTAFAGWPA
jgi:hypothetical protein